MMNGYKATDKDMKCQGFQFELGKWYEIPEEHELVLCKVGFHFCQQPIGSNFQTSRYGYTTRLRH